MHLSAQGARGFLHDIVDVALASPEARAVTAGDDSLSYSELLCRAAAIRTGLLDRGVAPRDTVAVCLERGADQVAAVLAIWLAGGTVLGLDPSYPPGRLEYMAEDSRAAVVLVDGAAPSLGGHVTTCTPASGTSDAWRTVPLPASDPALPLYVTYTSGSTGTPKGIAVPHRCIERLVAWQSTQGPPSRSTLQFAPSSFDVYYQELLSTWTTGGCLVVARERDRRDPEALVARLLAEEVDRIFLPFVALQLLTVGGGERRLPALRQVITAGEQLRVTEDMRAFFATNPDARLTNQYGPSETHVLTAYDLPPDPAGWPTLPPIGHVVIPGSGLAVLEPGGEAPVAPGDPGEIVAYGDCLAAGYVGRPDETAARFPELVVDGSRRRTYRTGDLARVDESGELHFLGRIDAQVKVRGYRIEPGEVEAALERAPGVARAAVTALGSRLVAFVVATDPESFDSGSALRAVATFLPDYAVPAAVQVVPDLPLTPSGKVDRGRLSALYVPTAVTEDDEPVDPVEREVAAAFASVLGLASVGRGGDFVALGGQSLDAARVSAEIRTRLRVVVPVTEVLRLRAVDAVAAFARTAAPAPEPATTAVPPGPRPLTPEETAVWLANQYDPEDLSYNLGLAIELGPDVDVAALEEAVRLLAQRWPVLAATFPDGDDGPVARPGGTVTVGRRTCGRDEWHTVATELVRAPYDLTVDPPMRATVLDEGGGTGHLVVALHHVATDAGGLDRIVADLGALYDAVTGAAAPPPRPAPAAVVVEPRDEDVAWWVGRLTDVAAPVPDGSAGTRAAVRAERDLTSAESAALATTARSLGVTLFALGVATFAGVLRDHLDVPELLVGTPLDRGRLAGERGVAHTADILVLRLGAAETGPSPDAVRRAHDVVQESLAHASVSFRALLRALRVRPSPGAHPLVRVTFQVDDPPVQAVLAARTRATTIVPSGEIAPTLMATLVPGEVTALTLTARRDAFARSTLDDLLGQWATRLGAIVGPAR